MDLDAIERHVIALATRIGADPAYLPTYGTSRQDGTPHIEVGRTYDFVVCERGSERDRLSLANLDALLYRVFSSVTFSMASRHELAYRRAGEDCRRQLFSEQVRLLAILAPAWAAQEAVRHGRILERHPFVDG